jgi:hypothetical protein
MKQKMRISGLEKVEIEAITKNFNSISDVGYQNIYPETA